MPFLLAALAPMLWGSTYAVVHLSLTDLPPLWVAVWRALPAGLLLLLLARRRPPLPWGRLIGLSFCNITAFFCLLFLAAYRLPGAVAGTLGATLPLTLMALNWLRYGQRPSGYWLALALLGLAGVMLLVQPGTGLDPIGVACALSATLLVAQSTLWMQRWAVQDLLGLTAWQLTLGGLMLLPVAWLGAGPSPLPSGPAWPGLAWLILANTALAYWIWVWAIDKLGAQRLGMLSLTNPLVAVGLGTLWVGERLGPGQWLGIGLILASLLLMKRPQRTPRRDPGQAQDA
ncbi:DMT family transporter [Pseudaeromonas paramecii]|uniref:EamA family transporter n=1 Tax=Pseudaeromonas paramecii TaxID=2138166 RepID=A0ABP8QAX9_9GAMM